MEEPLSPRITKSTAPSLIRARFATNAKLLKRFIVAKDQANLWDGERDGLREAVKLIETGRHDDVILSRKTTAAVCYPNAEGKAYLEEALITTIGRCDDLGAPVIALQCGLTPEELVNNILHRMQTSKEYAVKYITEIYLGAGIIVDNGTLYKKEEGEKTSITILPEV